MLLPHGRFTSFFLLVLLLVLPCVYAPGAQAQIGNHLPGLKTTELNFFNNGKHQFLRVWGMQEGVGPVLTDGACSRCHNTPVLGGGGNRLLTFFGQAGPDNMFDGLDGLGPSGLNEGGLLLQPRSNQAFLPNCPQGGEVVPVDANVVENRMGPPTFGFGLIDSIADADIQAEAVDKGSGVHGVANVGIPFPLEPFPVHTVGRFGKKAQMANLIEMAAFAFAHDLGITNPLIIDEDLPQGQPIDPSCTLNTSVPNNGNTGSGGNGIFPLSHFMRYLAPAPLAACPNGATDCAQGQAVFSTIGCDKCHKPSYTTPASVRVQTDLSGTTLSSPALSNQTVGLYSDLLLHDLGNADKGVIPEGHVNTSLATLSQWRTTPLWGLQYRTRFMHSGGAADLNSAILGHTDGVTGEAVTIINNYKGLSPSDQTALLDFLKTL